uniref:Uncharacterized protein n=1 Tax=Arundo donax TaxID=35708 RepID=A0A0A9H8W7_ARUDO
MVGMKLLLPVSTDESPNTMIAGTFPAAIPPCSKKKINHGKYLWSDIAGHHFQRTETKIQAYKQRYS